MTRTASGATLALLNTLEPEAKAGWEEEILNIPEAINASRAITERRVADAAEAQLTNATTVRQAAMDLNTITIRALPAETQANLLDSVRNAYDPDFQGEVP